MVHPGLAGRIRRSRSGTEDYTFRLLPAEHSSPGADGFRRGRSPEGIPAFQEGRRESCLKEGYVFPSPGSFPVFLPRSALQIFRVPDILLPDRSRLLLLLFGPAGLSGIPVRCSLLFPPYKFPGFSCRPPSGSFPLPSFLLYN